MLADAHALGFGDVTGIDCHDLYFIAGNLSETDRDRLATELLTDSLAQIFCWRENDPGAQGQVIETALRPGVTDTVAEQIVRGARELGIAGVAHAATGQRFVVRSAHPMADAEMRVLARRLLVNLVIQRYALGTIEAAFPQSAESSGHVEIVPVRELGDDELLAVSRTRRAALDLNEMRAIQAYFRRAAREPSDVEFETIAQTWSEHCSHKTFRGKLEVGSCPSVPRGLREKLEVGSLPSNVQFPTSNFRIDGLLKTYIRAATEKIGAPWVRSAFVDNAGIIDFDDEVEISFKVETHNHPSAIEPFGGANTGVGGVIRDILGVSAKPIAATDVLCFGPQQVAFDELPEGVLHPRRIRSGVVAGVQDYGNKIGIPTVSGAIWYDAGYTANPLVFCGCVGIAPKGKHASRPQPGDRVIVLGGRTGRDGLRGATFSSMTMDAQTGEVSGASVQIGAPITEKGLIEVIVRARDQGLYHAITDCGAGGLSSAVGELARHTGADVDLASVRLKYAGLAPWEIWLSEAQERMVLAVPSSSLPQLQSLCGTFDVELTGIGAFTDTNQLVVRYDRKIVLDLANDLLFNGMPQRSLAADLPQPPITNYELRSFDFGQDKITTSALDLPQTLLHLLSHPNIASKNDVIRIYDHEVQGGTVVKPLTGALDDGPSDACVLKPIGTQGTRGVVLACGINPEFGKRDPYRMAVSVVDEAIRNAVAVGADPDRIALLDNFCWGDPLRPETLGGLVEAARGCHDAALHYGAPFISGKDSLNNEYLGADGLRHAIPPTLLISAMGIIQDVTRAVTMDFKAAGNVVYLLGETRAELGGSHFAVNSDELRPRKQLTVNSPVPGMPTFAPAMYRALHRAMRAGIVRACHDLSEGGIAVALAEMCIGGRLGCAIALDTDDAVTALFSESNGRLLAEVQPDDCAAFEAFFADLPISRIGAVTQDPRLTIANRAEPILALDVAALVAAWSGQAQ
ncbi:MAG: phosphoribosylformylglycinamidine synthase subunit PurL [Chloroflexi bacterium]|nr:phosphoribosylformylglycinamidine synthase subunit PurL [Chloroflexota bacterium]